MAGQLCLKDGRSWNRAESKDADMDWGAGQRGIKKRAPTKKRAFENHGVGILPVFFAGDGVDDLEVFDVETEVGAEGQLHAEVAFHADE